MSTAAVETAELYHRFKALTVTASAALILGEGCDKLRSVADELHRDAAGTPCEEPAALLRRLVHGEVTEAALDSVRSSHRRLRREVWTTQPCEYVPCCAGTHDHR